MRSREDIIKDGYVKYDFWVDHCQRTAIIELLLDIREQLIQLNASKKYSEGTK